MKPRIGGDFWFTAFLGLFVVLCLFEGRNLPENLQLATNIAGYTTLVLIVLLLVGTFKPDLLSWTEMALQDLWGGSGEERRPPPEERQGPPPWRGILKSMSYAVGFLALAFAFGFYLIPPIFLAFYLVVEAEARPFPAIAWGVGATTVLTTGMRLANVEVWAGAIPEFIPGYLGGSFIPPI